MAEGAFRAAAARSGLTARVESAGTASYHIGHQPDPRAIAIASLHGVDITGQAARQLTHHDFYRFSHIIALDRANLEGVRARAPRDGTAQLSLLLDAVEGLQGEPVPDPYHGDVAAFETAWSTINLGVDAWVARLIREGTDLAV